MNNYQIYDEIGKGRHSVVYKGRKKKSIEYYAIASIDKSQRQRVLTSVQFLRSFNHTNVIKFHNWYETNNHLWVITEYCIGGDLRAVLQVENKLPENSVRHLALDIAEGLVHIHSKGVLYMDLKPSNLLLDGTCSLRFYDFGLAINFDKAITGVASRVGTPSYMAPELFRDNGAPSIASDIWSFGCVLYEMIYGQPPFVANSIQGLINLILTEPIRRSDIVSQPFNDLLEAMLQKDPFQRASWTDVAQSEIWNGKLEVPSVFPPQPAFDKYKQLTMESLRTQSREAERRDKDILRASINAERNISRALKDAVGYQKDVCNELHLDHEVDFGEHEAEANEQTPDSLGTKDQPTVTFQILANREQLSLQPPANISTVCVEQQLYHPTDAHIRPLVMNSRIEKVTDPKYDPATLGFPVRSLPQLKQMSTKELESFLTTVYRMLSSQLELTEKQNVLSYFETLCTDAFIANVIINSSVMTLCVKFLSQKNLPSTFRATTASIMGLLVRHATFIHSDLSKSNIVSVVVQALQEENSSRAKRRLVACLGELLFYVATQAPQERVAWAYSEADVSSVVAQLLQDEDDVLKHYAVKTIENIVSIADRSVARSLFCKKNIVQLLLATFALPTSQSRTEHLRSSAVCSAMKLAMTDESLLSDVIFSQQFHLSSYGETLSSNSAKMVQILITLINFMCIKILVAFHLPTFEGIEWSDSAAASSTESVFSTTPLSQQTASQCLATLLLVPEDRFLTGMTTALEHSSAAIRGKAALTFTFLSMMDANFAARTCETKLFSCLDKLTRDKDPFVQKSMLVLYRRLHSFAQNSLATLAANATASSNAELKMTLQVMTSPALRSHVQVNEIVLTDAARCVEKYVGGNNEFESGILLLIEAFTQDKAIFSLHSMTIVSVLVPTFAPTLQSSEGDKRFASIRIIYELLSPIVNDSALYNPAASICPVVPAVNEFIIKHVVPLLPQLLDDGEPIPLYALKLLSTCAERSPTVVSHCMSDFFVGKLLDFLDSRQHSSSVHVLRLLLRVLQTGGVKVIAQATGLELVPKLLRAVQYAKANDLDSFFDPAFEIIFFVLCSAISDPASQIAQQSSYFIIDHQLEQLFLPMCAARQGTSSECAAASIFLLTQLFAEARQALLQPSTLSDIRNIMTDVDEPSSHVVLPLVRSLLLCVTSAATVDDIVPLQQDEPLLVLLQVIAQSSVNGDLSATAAELLTTLYNKHQ